MPKAYPLLKTRFEKLFQLRSAMAILGWDNATYMPKGSGEARADTITCLSDMYHELITAPEVASQLNDAKGEKLSTWDARNLQLMENQWKHANCLPANLVSEFSKTGLRCEQIWREAKPNNDFKTYASAQQNVLNLVREVANIKASSFGCSLYDALLDSYDAGRKSAQIDVLFTELKSFLPNLIQTALDQQKTRAMPIPLTGHFPIEKQKQLGEFFMGQLGFPFDKGRLDISSHPFCGGVPDDIRITTRYDEADFTSSLMGVLHETGHALYEAGLPREWINQPVGDALGMTTHESQSLFVEMQLCRSEAFIRYAMPHIIKAFDVSGDAWTVENLKAHYQRVTPDFIRVNADEVTYPAHILLRYELESAMISGDLNIADLPEAWNAKMQHYLGITPPDFAQGCMQDIHWTDGSFSYFPTYTLGAILAATGFAKLREALPNVETLVQHGDFAPIVGWLRENIHQHGSLYANDQLVEKVTGKPLNLTAYKAHLEKRYLNA